ncbi:MAG: hypothetical protein VKL59_20455 [Nostocaceae cyanobacterium]|nr:hypothetical protein [Nostocaceae cyanobacterium]
MSQEPPNSQPSFKRKPQQRLPRNNQESSRQQSVWKAQIIRLLRGTIGFLEGLVVKLETETSADAEQTPSLFTTIQQAWGKVLGTVRAFLPAKGASQLSDSALGGILAGIAVIFVWISTTLFSQKPPEIAIAPPVIEEPAPSPPEEPIAAPTVEEPSETITVPVEEEPQAREPEPEPEITPRPEPTPEPEITPQLEVQPEPEPAILTPEQNLIASIQNQVAEVSDRFAEGLIKSIKANFPRSSLSISVSNEWYNLKSSQQNQLAAQMFQRSQELDFYSLEITDSRGRLIARSPVVGNEMIIFQRYLPAKSAPV